MSEERYGDSYGEKFRQYEDKIRELEKKNKVLAQNLEDTEIVSKALEKENTSLKDALEGYKQNAKWCDKCDKIAELKKENAELKKNYEDSLIACGVLKAKVDTLAQPSPIEAMQDALITTQKVASEKQKEQLTKATEIIKDFLLMAKVEHLKDRYETVDEAEQFLNENSTYARIQKAKYNYTD